MTLVWFLVVTISWFRRAFEHSYGKHDYYIYLTSIVAKTTLIVNIYRGSVAFAHLKFIEKSGKYLFILRTNKAFGKSKKMPLIFDYQGHFF